MPHAHVRLDGGTADPTPEVIRADIVIVGGGGAGLRAAIAAHTADPGLSVALLSKVVPMRSHTVAAEGGAAAGDPATTTASLALHFA